MTLPSHITNVSASIENRVAYLTLNNPPVNALNRKTLDDLEDALRHMEQSDDVKVMVISGNGKCFAAGADIKEFVGAFDDKEAGKQLSLHAQAIFNKIEKLNKPVIAAINGACLGGGLELAMSCHIRIAAEEAKLGQPEVNLGLIPGFGGTQRLPRLINKGRALEMILTGQPISGQEAERIGLINKAVPLAELKDTVKQMAEQIALTKGKASIAATLAAVNQGMNSTFDGGLVIEAEEWAELFATADVKEGVNAFLEKRTAQFTDR
jgi:Enoyl-CoA hydratase/carnithine racemase